MKTGAPVQVEMTSEMSFNEIVWQKFTVLTRTNVLKSIVRFVIIFVEALIVFVLTAENIFR